MAGRDIGTVVLPDADLKIFLDASVEERARRRTAERGLDPASAEAGAILEDLRRRDELDSHRAVAPLRIAADARIIRTDGNTFEDTSTRSIGAIRDAEARACIRAGKAVRRPRRARLAPHDAPNRSTHSISRSSGRCTLAGGVLPRDRPG